VEILVLLAVRLIVLIASAERLDVVVDWKKASVATRLERFNPPVKTMFPASKVSVSGV
jgi:hypothetical protein